MTATAERIREQAYSLGFCAVGFAAAGPAPGADRLRRWLAEGMHGTMDYMAARASEREDPRLLVAGARTVVMLAMDYYHPPEAAETLQAGQGRVARYAWGRDYHNVIGKRLMKLQRFIRSEHPELRVYKEVDTGPVLERSWAQEAGVASMGKASNVLRREQGSWLLLGSLVLDRALPVDLPAPDLCGACTACIDVCPTGAILAPGVVDARQCIAYLTIEHRGSISPTLRSALGSWVFGCDDCQTVCPWSDRRSSYGEPALAPIPGRSLLNLEALLGSDDEEFHSTYLGSPLRRAGGPGIRRNAALVLGNQGRAAAIPSLDRALGDDSAPSVRGAAAWALGEIGGRRARAALDRRRNDPDTGVTEEVENALARS